MVFFPLKTFKNLHSFLGTDFYFYSITFTYYIIRNSRGLDTFYYKENYCYEYEELLFDGQTPEEFIACRPEARLLPSGVGGESERAREKTHVVKHRNRSWKIKTVEGGAKGTGNDYQEDELNGERLCSYFVAYKTFWRQLNIGAEHIV